MCRERESVCVEKGRVCEDRAGECMCVKREREYERAGECVCVE